MLRRARRGLQPGIGVAGVVLGMSLIVLSYVGHFRQAEAAVEEWTPGHSWIQHIAGWRSTIKIVGDRFLNDPQWMMYYNNAVGSWNSYFADYPFVAVGSGSGAMIHVLEAGSFDEAVIDYLKATQENYYYLNTCEGARGGRVAWGIVVPYSGNNDPLFGQWYSNFKVCLWPDVIPNEPNGQQLHYRWLTIKHELGHVLSLGDDRDGDACLMRDGRQMLEICSSELNFVHSHYNRY